MNILRHSSYLVICLNSLPISKSNTSWRIGRESRGCGAVAGVGIKAGRHYD